MRARFTSATNVTTLPLMRPGLSITKSTDTKVSHLIVTNVISREHLRGLFQGTQQAYTSIENSIAQHGTIKAQSLSASASALRRPPTTQGGIYSPLSGGSETLLYLLSAPPRSAAHPPLRGDPPPLGGGSPLSGGQSSISPQL